ncbi:hypothetical protein AB8G87_17580, partial [Salmonella enterica]
RTGHSSLKLLRFKRLLAFIACFNVSDLYSLFRYQRFWLIQVKHTLCCAREEKRYNPAIFFVVASHLRIGEEYEDRGSQTPTRQTQAGSDA